MPEGGQWQRPNAASARQMRDPGKIPRVKAVVMAGGEGTRLRPLTSNQPKPMVPIAGKPCMEHILELVRRHGITNGVATLAYMPQVISGYFGEGSHLGDRARLLRRGGAGRHGRQREARRATTSTRRSWS